MDRDEEKEYAESIRVQLVDPSGGELVKTEAGIANLDHAIGLRKHRVSSMRQIQC